MGRHFKVALIAGEVKRDPNLIGHSAAAAGHAPRPPTLVGDGIVHVDHHFLGATARIATVTFGHTTRIRNI